MIWDKEDTTRLRNDYLIEGEKSLSKILNRSPNAIRIKASRLGLSKLQIRHKIKLIDAEEQVILGTLLGDSYCRIRATCKNANLEGAHCKAQEEYLLWKIGMLGSLSFHLRRTNLGYLFFESRAFPCLNYYNSLFYSSGKKRVDGIILSKVDSLALSVWYMDDGSYSKRDRNSNLHTNGFTYEENSLIKDWFFRRWGIISKIYTIRKRKNYPCRTRYFIHFGAFYTKKLFEIIRPYVHPSMLYKLGVTEIKSE